MSELLTQALNLLGPSRCLLNAHDTEGYQNDWRGRYRGSAMAVFLPANTAEVVAIVKLCQAHQVAIVPQGGNTGLVGASIAEPGRAAVIVNLSKMNAIREIDLRNNSITVEVGAVLATVREKVAEQERLFPMLLGSVGSCEIGGLISTNAGGTGVLRYGNMRELVLGIEAVLPDGSVLNALTALRKDNTGYDLKQLFIGAEGTLGIVTAACLKLFPALSVSVTAMVATHSVAHAVDLLRFLQSQVGGRIEAFELMSQTQIACVLAHTENRQSPMPLEAPFYVLIELADSSPAWNANEEIEQVLSTALERELITDAVVASDGKRANKIWELRHSVSEANKKAGFTVSNDTSVPVSSLPEFIDKVGHRLALEVPHASVNYVGHIGDGNIHVVVVLDRAHYTSQTACESQAQAVNHLVHEESVALRGSISAEHGIGKMHVHAMRRFKDPMALALMRTIKASLDPAGLMNPGKIF
ncbi:MAG: hypothetical protein RLZZ502_1645 [Pseudomonadota bacterium]|jgi:FAD/FMN-containing dehydrogenase